jgi:hypothetical protein
MTSTGSIHFTDLDSSGAARIGVRVEDDRIGLSASLTAGGDIEVFFGRGEAEALRDALTDALSLLRG